ncbi:MAG TPA: hypothetical protein VGJ84_02955, partial [Polyangiaceae bacterium]
PEYTDISAGQGTDSGWNPSAVIDATNGKLLVVTDNGANSHKPALFRCNLDGTGCAYADISAGQGTHSGLNPSAVIDAANARLLVVTNNGRNSHKPALFRCNLDGTGCTYTDISAGQGEFSGSHPSAVIDSTNRKLLVVAENGANSYKPALFRCNLDGTGCTYTDISAGQGPNSGDSPTALIDSTNDKLLVVTNNGANWDRAALFRCNLDGTGCTYTDISAGQGPVSPLSASAVIYITKRKLLVITAVGALFRCNLDGTGCTYTDISAGQGVLSGFNPSAVIDSTNGKLLVVTTNFRNSLKLGLFRCNLDGTGCTYTDISAGQGVFSGFYPSAVIDTANGKLLVATKNGANANKPALFQVCLQSPEKSSKSQ